MNEPLFDTSHILIGSSRVMTDLRATIARFGPTSIPVLVQGPSGAGKELVARAIHCASRRSGNLVAVNMCAISDTMFEDALFGHAKGAFTGANREVPGLLAEANGGTLFLDEISGLSLACQVKMLRAIELGAFRPVGATRDRVSDFRVVAASNEDLVALVERQRFRGDLLHRLGGMVLEVPPLSEHSDDIPELVEHFLRAMCSHAGITSAALSRLLKHSWPGNIRELRHTVERAFVLADGGEVTFEAVAAALERSSVPGLKRCVDDFAKNCMLNLLEECRWNTDKVATSLGVHRATVYRRMERLGIEPRERDSALIVRRDDRLMELA